MEDLSSDYEGQGFQIIGVMIDGVAADWADQFGLSFPILDDNSLTLWNRYEGRFIPLNLIFDKNMVIRYKESGFNELEVESIIGDYISPP